MKNIKNFNNFIKENKNINLHNELPTELNIDKELKKLKYLEKQALEIEEIIKYKLDPILNKYLENGDYEGAKRFVGNSYKDMNTSGKVLLFRKILLHEKGIK